MRTLLFVLFFACLQAKGQNLNCTLKPPVITIDFGTGSVEDLNPSGSYAYQRVSSSCPSDGHYAYTSYTSDCFRSDWITLEDHTPGDVSGNMMLVNASYRSGYFLTTMVDALEAGKIYEFGVWMTNVCKLSDKCPFPLLPDITIRIETVSGRLVAQLETGELIRRLSPQWTQYTMTFTAPASNEKLVITMIDNVPGGCGNDFALDDITFRECVKIPPPPPPKPVVKKTVPKTSPVATKKADPPTTKKTDPPAAKKTDLTGTKKTEPAIVKKAELPATKKTETPSAKKAETPPVTKPNVNSTAKKPEPGSANPQKGPPGIKPEAKKEPTQQPVTSSQGTRDTPVTKLPSDLARPTVPPVAQRPPKLVPPPPALTRRANTLFKQIQMDAGEIKIDLYDNGEIDGDTVTIYHNNVLVVSKARLSQKPVTLRIAMDPANPHHEIVMVAENLGSIPPNTSLMIVTAGTTRYEVFISSTEERNAKVILDLKQ